MALDPRTVNIGMIVPLTGSDVDTWGEVALNPDFVALDGLLGGVQTIGLTSIPVTLTSPASYTATPGPGPTQSQNSVLRFTGVLTAHVTVTLPIPGRYIVENYTTGNFAVQLSGAVAQTEVVALPPGETVTVYNDGSRVRFVDMGRLAGMELWAGLIAIPLWVAFCTVPPYMLCNGSVHNFTEAPYLGARLLATFGGNGSTTFGVPDMQGRVPLAYDGTGTRITTAGCGLNGQTLGAVLDQQTVQLTAAKIPNITSTGTSSLSVAVAADNWMASNSGDSGGTNTPPGGGGSGLTVNIGSGSIISKMASHGSTSGIMTVDTNGTGGAAPAHANVQPSQVVGIWVIRTT